MSDNDELVSDDESSLEDDVYLYYDELESSEPEAALSAEDHCLFSAVERNDADAAAAVQQTIRDGANVNAVRRNRTPLFLACYDGYDEIVGILLDAGADARWSRKFDSRSAINMACRKGHLSTVQLLINHDNGLLETVDNDGWTPLFYAVRQQHIDLVRFLLERGANAHSADRYGYTALMAACEEISLEIVRLLLAAGVDVEARDRGQYTALQYAACSGSNEVVCELILQHNANIFAVNVDGLTPFDLACRLSRDDVANTLLEVYGNKLAQDHGRLALHELVQVAEYSVVEDHEFHTPLNPLRIILPLGELTLKHLRTLLRNMNHELIRNQDDTGKLPIHIACQTNAPVDVLALMVELDPATLHIADSTGALPIHLLCGTTPTTDYASVRFLVERGGVGTLAARNRQGLLPLHVLCESTNPPLRAVQYLIQSFPGSVTAQTDSGQYPFMMAAAAESSSASLIVIYELVRANPGLVVPI